MKISKLVLALVAMSASTSAFAGVLQLENSASVINGVTISKGGKLVVEGRTTNVITVGAGVRTALAGIVKAYVGELLVSDNKKYVCDKAKALDSLKDLSAAAVRVTVTYGFSKDKLIEAFTAGFEANNVDTKRADIKKFMDVVAAGGDANKGSVISFGYEKLADSEAVTYEDSNGKVTTIKGQAGFAKAIFGLWLGKTDDSGLKDLNTRLTTCQI